jgi:hypothetical protein
MVVVSSCARFKAVRGLPLESAVLFLRHRPGAAQLESVMGKPIVFLSHSSRDKAALVTLKKLLDDRAAGSLNFFLSSDGESIRFGRNWVVRISDALSQAKLMFVFLSPQSADSKWIHFEAGCAYAKDIQVVPVCLPGIDLNRITPPLSLLQGFNLHSHDAMGNLARICNKEFDMKIDESFSGEDFDNIISNTTGHIAGFFGSQTSAIERIQLESRADSPAEDFNPIPALHTICKKAGTNCHYSSEGNSPGDINANLEQPGCTVKFQNFLTRQRVHNPPAPPTMVDSRQYIFECSLSPELFHLNAPLLDQWLGEIQFPKPLWISIIFGKQIVCEPQRERFTSKLYQSGIRLVEKRGFAFERFEFNISRPYTWVLEFHLAGKLGDDRVPQILDRLFKSMVLWEHEPDFSELFQGG